MAVIEPTADPKRYQIGKGRACLEPNRMNDRPVDTARPLPGVIILVHGVNDLGVSYPAQETGLCKGLNERLSREDLAAAGYRLPAPKRDEKLEADPDATYYRRDGQGYGPVIPFYWGYREYFRKVQTNAPHGQYLDRHGNRLDKSGAQGGGPFANATSNLPDMWDGGFKAYAGFVNWTNADPTHPLCPGPDRRYMVLAALRLAALIEAIRKASEHDTVTLVGHSQGCLLSLLAQAFLHEWGQRPADTLILNHPPYSLDEPLLEKLQTANAQQSTYARLTTLQNLVRFVTATPHAQPTLAALADGQCGHVCGPFWTPSEGKRPDPARPGSSAKQGVTFAERDNRGKVYLYFCPEDLTVGLDSVIGIGSLGVPEKVSGTGETGKPQTFSALASLGPRFLQRIFTMRERQGQVQPVGGAPMTYCLRERGEDFRDYVPATHSTFLRHAPKVGETRRITGEPLSPPWVPDLRCGEIAKGALAVDPIEAAVAITNDGIGTQVIVDDPAGPRTDRRRYPALSDIGELRKIEESLNAGKAAADRCRVRSAVWVSPGKVEVTRTETPDEARLRWQSTQSMENSYHSAIVANPEHSRHVHAFDVAIGEGETVSNPTYRDLLLKIADWRVVTKKNTYSGPVVLLKDLKTNAFYKELPARMKTFVEANARYYTEGTLPLEVIPKTPPEATVVSATLLDAKDKGIPLGQRR